MTISVLRDEGVNHSLNKNGTLKSRNKNWMLIMIRVIASHSTVLLQSLKFEFAPLLAKKSTSLDKDFHKRWAPRSFGSKTLPKERDPPEFGHFHFLHF